MVEKLHALAFILVLVMAAGDEAPKPPPRPVVWVFYTAPWCVPCVEVKNDLVKLRENGWSITDGDDDSGHIVLLDTDAKPEATRAARVTVLPTLVLYRDGKEVKRYKPGMYPGHVVIATDYLAEHNKRKK